MSLVPADIVQRDLIAQMTAVLIDHRQKRRAQGLESSSADEWEVARDLARQFFDQRESHSLLMGIADLGLANQIDLTKKAIDAVLAGRAPNADQRPSIGCNIKWRAAQG